MGKHEALLEAARQLAIATIKRHTLTHLYEGPNGSMVELALPREGMQSYIAMATGEGVYTQEWNGELFTYNPKLIPYEKMEVLSLSRFADILEAGYGQRFQLTPLPRILRFLKEHGIFQGD